MTLKKSIAVAAGVLLIGIVWWRLYAGEKIGEPAVFPEAVATSSEDIHTDISGLEYGFVGQASSTPSAKPSMPVPAIDYPIVVPPGLLATGESSSVANLNRIIAKLKETPENAALWAQLGFYRKGVEDYKGAKEALEYSLALSPLNVVALDNLGVVYAYYLKEPLKAEEYFLKVVTLEPKVSYRYLRLFELYTYSMKDEAKAKAILERGLQAIPGEPSLKVLLES